MCCCKSYVRLFLLLYIVKCIINMVHSSGKLTKARHRKHIRLQHKHRVYVYTHAHVRRDLLIIIKVSRSTGASTQHDNTTKRLHIHNAYARRDLITTYCTSKACLFHFNNIARLFFFVLLLEKL